jgi:hypothetical protein
MTTVDIEQLSDRQLAARIIPHMRRGGNLAAWCRDKKVPYRRIIWRLERSGLKAKVLGAKYHGGQQ